MVAWQTPEIIAGGLFEGENCMSADLKSRRVRITLALALPTLAVALLLMLRGNPAQAQAQGPMSAPACQCSPAVAIPGMGSRIAHCICGVMACALTEPIDATRGSSSMQCVRQ